MVLVLVDVFTTTPAAFVASGPTAATVLGAGVLHTEISLRLERVRKRVVEGTAHVEMNSVWTFAATVLLPALSASIVVIVFYLYLHFRVYRLAKAPPYRQTYTLATILLAVHGGSGVLAVMQPFDAKVTSLAGLTALVVALVTYTLINMTLIIAAVAINSTQPVRKILGRGEGVAMELATLSLGALVAVVVIGGGLPFVVFVLPPLVILHKAALVRQLEHAVSVDSKTGLLSAGTFHYRAVRQLKRARRFGGAAGLLVLDLDYFKAVNDVHGHLAGDRVLAAVGAALRAEVRDHDLVGRFGGEEFVILLPQPHAHSYRATQLLDVAERIRTSIEKLRVEIPTPDGPLTLGGLSVSIGGAIYPADGDRVEDVSQVADSAMYDAKRSGRNTVRIGSRSSDSPAPISFSRPGDDQAPDSEAEPP